MSFDLVHEKLRDSYSDTGRPSIDPEVLLRILLLGDAKIGDTALYLHLSRRHPRERSRRVRFACAIGGDRSDSQPHASEVLEWERGEP